jgi:ribosome-binding protein aMBF1 (putative translation factor)
MQMIGASVLVEEDRDQIVPPTSRKVFVAVDENGLRIGEAHPNAKLSDKEVDQIRDLREQAGWGYEQLATAYNVPKVTIQMICTYQRRASTIARWKVLLLHTPISLTNHPED